MTLAELIDEIQDYLGNRTDVFQARITRALNIAQEHIARSWDYEDLRRIVSGQTLTASDRFLAFSELPAGLQQPREIYSFRVLTGDGRARKLIYRTARSMDRLVPEPDFYAEDTPTHYTIWNDRFELWRVPDQAYSYELRMSIWPTEFDVDQQSASSDFDHKDDMLIYLAVSWIYGQLGEYDRMNHFYNMYNIRAKEAQGEDSSRPDQDIVSDQGKARPEAVISRPWSDPFVRMIR